MALRPGVMALQARLGHQDLQKAQLPGRRRLVQHAPVTGPDHHTFQFLLELHVIQSDASWFEKFSCVLQEMLHKSFLASSQL